MEFTYAGLKCFQFAKVMRLSMFTILDDEEGMEVKTVPLEDKDDGDGEIMSDVYLMEPSKK